MLTSHAQIFTKSPPIPFDIRSHLRELLVELLSHTPTSQVTVVSLEQRIRVVLPCGFVEEESVIKCEWPIKLDEAFVHMRKGRGLEDGGVLRHQAIAQSGPCEKVDCNRMCRGSLR